MEAAISLGDLGTCDGHTRLATNYRPGRGQVVAHGKSRIFALFDRLGPVESIPPGAGRLRLAVHSVATEPAQVPVCEESDVR